jgi:hypothetical protein
MLFRKRVKSNIEKTIRECGLVATVVVCSNGNILVGGDIQAWIRLTEIPTRKGIINQVDVNNIMILHQRKGTFTRLMKNLASLKTVDHIVITSVSTQEMHNWCRKNKCSVYEVDLRGYPLSYQYKP